MNSNYQKTCWLINGKITIYKTNDQRVLEQILQIIVGIT